MYSKLIRSYTLVSCFTALVSIAFAQPEFTAEASQLLPSFKFKDSEGTKHNSEYQSLITGAYGIGLRYIFESGIYLRGGVGLRNAGANLVYDNVNYSWKMQYADIKLGIGYRAKFKTIRPYLVASGYFAPLLRGTQTLHDETINITKSGVIKTQDLGLNITPGIDIKFTQYISSYIEFNYLMGLTNIELNTNQKATNSAFGLTVGVAFLLMEK